MAMISGPDLPYAVGPDGKMKHVDEVENGLKCNCTCPRCGSKLIACQGQSRSHSFRHENSADCVGSVESMMHRLAKEILMEQKVIALPSANGKAVERLHFDRVEVEQYDPVTGLRPDCVGYYGDKVLWIEFKRTHEVDRKKTAKIVSARIDCLEIDLINCGMTRDSIMYFIINKSDRRVWVYNQMSNIKKELFGKDKRRKSEIQTHYWQEGVRHFARDEQGKIVCLDNLNEFDFNKHSYYCVNCGKEVTLGRDDNFNFCIEHLEEGVVCPDEYYLYKLAKEMLASQFDKNQGLSINVSIENVCSECGDCEYYDEESCKKSLSQQFDLKSLGYDKCLMDFKIDDFEKKADLVFVRGESSDSLIALSINVGQINKDLPDYNCRHLAIEVESEVDVASLMSEKPVLNSYFSKRFGNSVSRQDFEHDYVLFTLRENGDTELKQIRCCRTFKFKEDGNTKLLYANQSLDLVEKAAVRYLYRRNKRINMCRLCVHRSGNYSYCTNLVDRTVCVRFDLSPFEIQQIDPVVPVLECVKPPFLDI